MKPSIDQSVFGSITIDGQVFEHDVLIIGSGQAGNIQLSKEAAAYFGRKRCQVELLPTPQAIAAWNESEGAVIGLFHVTC
jgi:hypothetical protein